MSSTSACSSPSPSESPSATVRPTSTRDDSPFVEPPRKRARSDLTTEQRREARAHRNRIAAQTSRDKRKAQLAYLENRVTELASGLQVSPPASTDTPLPQSTSSAGSLPTIVSPSPAAYPLSPATSTSSLSSSNIFDEFESTRHLARVATVESGAQLTPTSLQRVDSRQIIISPNSTPHLHHQRPLPPTTRSQNRSATALWRNSCGRSLPLHLRPQLRLSLSKFSPQIFKLPTSRRRPPSRRR